MATPVDIQAPKVERNGNVTIITFAGGKMPDVENMISKELEGRTEDLGESHLLLDFTNVDYLTSVELATLISLHKKMKASGGRLTLFNLNTHSYEALTITRLHTLIGICREEPPTP